MKLSIKALAVLSIFATPCFAGHNGISDFSKMTKPLDGIPLKEVFERQPVVAGHGEATYNRMADMWADMHDNFKYIDDATNYGKWYQLKGTTIDYWETLDEFVKKGGGDCEGWAIAAYYTLRKAGFKAEQLNIIAGFLPNDGNIYHAVISVLINDKEYILDQRNGKAISSPENYSPDDFYIMFYANENGWRAF